MVTSPASSSPDHTAAPRSRRSRVSAEHTLNRVRENQRRHRARQRDHVASLEQKLAETEKLLEEARAEIAALKGQATATPSYQQQPAFINNQTKEAAQGGGGRCVEEEGTTDRCTTHDIPTTGSMPSSQPSSSSLGLAVQPASLIDPHLAYPDVPNLSDLSFLGDASFYLPSSSATTTSLLPSNLAHIQDLAILSSPNINNITSPTPTGPPPCCADLQPPSSSPSPPSLSPSSLSPSPPTTTNNLECTSCKSRPPPSPSESTTLCAQAFVMIGQQNFRNLDPDTIRLWLAQGLRRARREGEGCRVENGALLRLLDFISGL